MGSRFILLMILAVVTGCRSASEPRQVEASRAAPSLDSGQLGPGDVIQVSVFREPELDGTYRLETEGTLDFPLVGEIPVVGLTPRQVQDLLTQRLEDGYLVDAQVRVLVQERNSKKVYVLGAVNKPGSFGYEPNMTVIQAIALAGGMSQVAQTNGVTVTRVDDGKEISFQVRVGDIQSGTAPNVFLVPGDIVFVREAIF